MPSHRPLLLPCSVKHGTALLGTPESEVRELLHVFNCDWAMEWYVQGWFRMEARGRSGAHNLTMPAANFPSGIVPSRPKSSWPAPCLLITALSPCPLRFRQGMRVQWAAHAAQSCPHSTTLPTTPPGSRGSQPWWRGLRLVRYPRAPECAFTCGAEGAAAPRAPLSPPTPTSKTPQSPSSIRPLHPL